MRRIDQNQKSVEGEEVLKLLSNKQLQFLKELYEQGGQEVVEIFDLLAMRAKETVYVYSKPGKSVDELIEVNGKQNLQSGRVSMLLLLDYLVSHAGKKLEGNMEGREK
jgi:hypothetical protein